MKWSELKRDSKVLNARPFHLEHLFDATEISPEDGQLAWPVFVELDTRITTQELHFLDGDEAAALTSVFNLFTFVRNAVRENGEKSVRVSEVCRLMLNRILRPFTAKWHRQHIAGRLFHEDDCTEFRTELRRIQKQLKALTALLYQIATNQAKAEVADAPKQKPNEQNVLGHSITFDRILGLEFLEGETTACDIRQKEGQEVADRRRAVDGAGAESDVSDLVGLSISGGGIRSATFGLGVLQELSGKGIVSQIDMVSTVSGGGYLGSFLSSYLNTPDAEHSSVDARNVPKPDEPFTPDVAADSEAIRSLRNNSRYILPSNFPRWVQTVGVVAYGILSNLVVLSVLVFAAVLMTHYTLETELQSLENGVSTHKLTYDKAQEHWSLWPGTRFMLGATVVALFLLPVIQRLGSFGKVMPSVKWFWEWLAIVTAGFALIVFMLNHVPLVHFAYYSFVDVIGQLEYKGGWSLSATAFSAVNLIGIMAARAQALKSGPNSGVLRKLGFVVLWLAGPALVVFAYLELCRSYVASPPPGFSFQLGPIGLDAVTLLWTLFGLALIYSVFVNINLTSLHQYYRNRLSETYLLQRTAVGKIESVDPLLLSELRRTPDSTAPYHLINGALNLPSSNIKELRGRDCDFFLFSKHFCGSHAIGFSPTKNWEAADAHLDLGTAMAISGAAAHPQMGMGSIPGTSFLMTWLNIRTGYWMRQPQNPETYSKFQRRISAPGPSYLIREACNQMRPNDDYLNLSDGGHVENLGIYELLRRRCKFIIAIDGECDPGLDCPSLMRLQDFASVDLDVEIKMDVSRLQLVEFPPSKDETVQRKYDEAPKPRLLDEPEKISRAHYAVGRIKYPDDEKGAVIGWLVYIKLSYTGNETDYVKDYRKRFPTFPHQSTADQVYSEDQFEAYRWLGRHAAKDLFSNELLTNTEPDERGSHKVKDWYSDLVRTFFPDDSHSA